jgi:hypothetical protein
MTETIAELIAGERRRERQAIQAVRGAVQRFDPVHVVEAFEQLEFVLDGWRKAMRAIVRLGVDPPARFRNKMLRVWAISGDHIRGEVQDDLLLADALRILLPVYRGPALRVWRGDSAWNRRRRTYGLSWSCDLNVADSFARGIWQTFKGGSVVLEADAPREAVICTIERNDHYGEKEILINRRRLSTVRLVARYEQRPIGFATLPARRIAPIGRSSSAKPRPSSRPQRR